MSPPEASGTVLVTGGAGAIGGELVRALVDRGRTVRVVDNLSTGRREQLPRSDRVALTVADLRDPPAYEAALPGVDEIWHLAANFDIRRGTADTAIDLEHGTIATHRILEAARRHDVRHFRFSSSSVVYGQAKRFPTPEEYGPMEPESLYGAAKLGAEGLVSAYAHSYGLRAHIFRFANIIAAGMDHGILPDFFGKLKRDPTRLEVLGDGEQAKSYLRTEDCVGGMLLAAEKAQAPVNLFNLGARDRIKVRAIAEKVVAAHGGTARIEFTGGPKGWVGDVPQQLLSIDRISALGWTPRFSSEGAIDRTIAEMVAARSK